MSAFVNVVFDSASGSSTTIPAPSMSNTAGNLLVVCVQGEGGTSVLSVADSAGNTYTLAPNAAKTVAGGAFGAIFYAKNIAANASNIVTATFAAAATFRSICVLQYSGLSTTAPEAGLGRNAEVASATSITSTSFTPPLSTDVVVCAAFAGGGATWGADANYVTRGTFSSAHAQDRVNAPASSQTVTTTVGGSPLNIGQAVAVFTAGGAPAPVVDTPEAVQLRPFNMGSMRR